MERKTRQRDAIAAALREADRPLSPQELLDLSSRQTPGIGIATVYRTIKAMVDERLLTPVEIPGEPPRYEVAGKSHHHHFHCKKCDRVYEMKGCPGPLKKLAPPGFEVQGHEVLLYGICSACQKSR